MRIVGLDPSLTAYGICTEDRAYVVKPRTRGPERLLELRRAVLTACIGADLVVIEDYAYSRANRAHQLGELGGVIRLALWEAGVPYIEVAPTTRARYATGSGRAGKDDVLAAARALGADVVDDNAADAWWLRRIGVHMLDRLAVKGTTTEMQRSIVMTLRKKLTAA